MSYQVNSFVKSEKEVPAYEKNISICLGTNGFSFAETSIHNEFLSFGEVSFDPNPSMSDAMQMVRWIFAHCGIVPLGMHSIELIVPSEQMVWVPNKLYQPSNERKYLETLCDITRGYTVYCDDNPSISSKMIFSAESNISSAFKIAIPGLKIRNQFSKLVNDDLIQRSDLRSLLVLHLRENHVDIVAFCNKTLQLTNTFELHNTQEAIYQALQVTKQLHLEEALMNTLICGDIDRAHFVEISHFFPNTDLYCGRTLDKQTDELRCVPAYRHALILS